MTNASRRHPAPRRAATVVVVGSINLDLVVQVPRLPQAGETLAGTAFSTLAGGKGANQAVAVARLGGRAIMIGRVGDDAFGARLLRGLRQEGVDVRHVLTLPRTTTGVASIAVEADGQNSIAIVSGANARLRPSDVRAAEPVIARADAILVQLETPLETVETALRLARKHGVTSVLDPAPVPKDGLPASWRKLSLDILSPNESEAAQLTGLPVDTEAEATRAATRLLDCFRAQAVVLKRGAHGALWQQANGPARVFPAFRVKAIDTTAAGDAFTAALALRLAEGATLSDTLPFASATGALATTRLGAQNSMPTRRAVQAFLRRA